MATNALLVLVILLVCMLYMSYYSKYSKEYNITQVFLDKFSPNILYERNPVVVYDSLADPQDLLKTVFKYQYMFMKNTITPSNKAVAVKSKYSIVYSSQDMPVTVKLINPIHAKDFKWYNDKQQRLSNTDIETTNIFYIDVQLKKHQVMILPPHWIIHSMMSLHTIDIDDIASYVYFKMF